MTDIVESPNPSPDVSVDLGDGQRVSMKAVQQIYAEITGRSETLSRVSKINHSANFDDLRQLNAKVRQLYEQYNIVSKTCTVTLYHIDDQKQTFSSFERFELFDRTTLSPVENVRIEFNFLIILPQMKRPQSYSIELNIHSRAALVKKARIDSDYRDNVFFDFFSGSTGHYEITYVDYTVARNFQIAIDGWLKSLPELATSRAAVLLQRARMHYAFIFKFVSVFAYLLVCSATLGSVAPYSDDSVLFRAAIVAFGGAYLLAMIGEKTGSAISIAIRRIHAKSYLRLTRGDELVADELSKSNRASWLKAAVSLLVAISTNVAAAWIASKLGISG